MVRWRADAQPFLAAFAQAFIAPALERLGDRARWWPLGCFGLRSGMPSRRLVIHGATVELALPRDEYEQQLWEFQHIYLDDPYRLSSLPGDLLTIVDIGGNIGFFSLVARQRFKTAKIHCYEPNAAVLPYLRRNLSRLDVCIFPEAVGLLGGRASMTESGSSLCSAVDEEDAGSIIVVSAEAVLARAGGEIDLLKLDCEGGEWKILKSDVLLRASKYLSMEYHLDRPGAVSLARLVERLNALGFSITSLVESDNGTVGQLSAVRR